MMKIISFSMIKKELIVKRPFPFFFFANFWSENGHLAAQLPTSCKIGRWQR